MLENQIEEEFLFDQKFLIVQADDAPLPLIPPLGVGSYFCDLATFRSFDPDRLEQFDALIWCLGRTSHDGACIPLASDLPFYVGVDLRNPQSCLLTMQLLRDSWSIESYWISSETILVEVRSEAETTLKDKNVSIAYLLGQSSIRFESENNEIDFFFLQGPNPIEKRSQLLRHPAAYRLLKYLYRGFSRFAPQFLLKFLFEIWRKIA